MRTIHSWHVLAALLLLGPIATHGADTARYQPYDWSARQSVSAKNFPWFALIDAQPTVATALESDAALRAVLVEKKAAVTRALAECKIDLPCQVQAFVWSDADVARVGEVIGRLARQGVLTPLADEMRRSGFFARDAALDPGALLTRTWEQSAAGLNNIMRVYGLGQAPRYAAIDAVAHDVATDPYRLLVRTAIGNLDEDAASWRLFYQPSLAFALALLDINWRDEAGRFEPMHRGENAAAVKAIPSIAWNDYPYSVIVVPGAGLERADMALDPQGKLRVALAARRYHQRKAPLLIVSGGYVHPNQTKFNEALEMKRALMQEFDVPEHAILIDPHARHTTTNLRNAARLMFRYGVPPERRSMITTDEAQSMYIEGQVFAERCDRELGYRPYELGKRLSRYDLEWLPRAVSLHADALDPLDP